MSRSERLSLPYLQPAQAQKHVTHNEALQQLDVLVQLAVEGIDADTPPSLPVAGEVHALGASPTEAWAGHAGELAAWIEGSWQFIAPQDGWQALDKSTGRLHRHAGGNWEDLALPDLANLPGVGINSGHDSTNRLSVSAPATLLNHEGAGHQLKLNKATEGDTASLLFQTGWSGRAEMGTTGGENFAIKVSADGANWRDAAIFDRATGVPEFPQGARIAGAEAYHRGNILGSVALSGGLPTGAVLESGSTANGSYLRLADGTQICWVTGVDMGSIIAAGAGTWAEPYRTAPVSLTWPVAFSEAPAATALLSPKAPAGPLESRAMALGSEETPSVTGWNSLHAARVGGSAHDNDVLLSVIAVGRWQ